jgi:hypothetical protein
MHYTIKADLERAFDSGAFAVKAACGGEAVRF